MVGVEGDRRRGAGCDGGQRWASEAPAVVLVVEAGVLVVESGEALPAGGGGAWPFLVGGVICLVNSDNERDLRLLNSYTNASALVGNFLEGLHAF